MELQRLAFNMADALDTFNCHSMSEADRDLRDGAFAISRELRARINKLLKKQDEVNALLTGIPVNEFWSELKDMDVLLDVLDKSTRDRRNYQDFVESLIPLLRLCEAWGEQGPLSARGVF